MSIDKYKKHLAASIEDQARIVPLNSKYTYAHLSHFHQTILTILGNKNLVRLNISDLKNIAHFTNLIINLLELPHMAYQTQLERNNFSYKKPAQIGHSNKCLRALLKWISRLTEKENLTLETILDEYYTNFPYAQKINNPPQTNTLILHYPTQESSGKTYI